MVSLLPVGEGQPGHDCIEIMNEVLSSLLNIRDQHLKDSNAKYFIDGSSFVKKGQCLEEHSVVTLNFLTEAKSLKTSA